MHPQLDLSGQRRLVPTGSQNATARRAAAPTRGAGSDALVLLSHSRLTYIITLHGPIIPSLRVLGLLRQPGAMSGFIDNRKGTLLVTGANGGLGSALVSRIVSKHETAAYHGVYTARNADAACSLKQALQRGRFADLHSHDVLSLELTNLNSVRAVAAGINSRVASGEIPPIRALVLNAGYLEFRTQTWTEDGFDMTFASNYLGHWLLTVLLLQSMDKEAGRIVVIGSESHDPHNAKSKAAFNQQRYRTFFGADGCEPIARGTWSSTKEDSAYNWSVLLNSAHWTAKSSLGVERGFESCPVLSLGGSESQTCVLLMLYVPHSGFRRYGASKFCQAMMM